MEATTCLGRTVGVKLQGRGEKGIGRGVFFREESLGEESKRMEVARKNGLGRRKLGVKKGV